MSAPVLGLFQPGKGWLFEMSVGWKYLIVLVVTLPPLIFTTWWVTLLALALVLAVLRSSGITLRRALNVGWMLWLLSGIMAAYHLISLNPLSAIVHPGNILVAVLAARISTLTTPVPELIDALVAFLKPIPGVNEDKVALAVALMIRSIPYLIGSVDDARDAATARGLSRNPIYLLTPAMLNTAAYAERTGEALSARGVLDR